MIDASPHRPEEGRCSAEKGRCGCHDVAPVELAAVREQLSKAKGPAYWRSLEELAGTPAFGEMLHREFPRLASEWPSGVSRRGFLELSAASLGLAGLTACTRQPIEKLVPYVRQPEEILPGRPQQFATAMPSFGGFGVPLLAESQVGRPTKVEGNPEHAASRGASDLWAQASVLGLYDPDRSQTLTHLGQASSWPAFLTSLTAAMNAQRALGGAGLRILTAPTTSPTFGAWMGRLLSELPQAKWHRWDAAGRDAARAGARAALGTACELHFDVAKADVVVALESDFLVSDPGALAHARAFAARRKVGEGSSPTMNRLYVVESSPTPTGSSADHRFAAKPSEIERFALALAARLGVAGATAPELPAELARAADAIARDLAAHRGASLVVAGDCLSADAHALVAGVNAALGNLGATVVATEPIEVQPTDGWQSLAELTADLAAGRVDLLIVSGANPVYDAPAHLGFAGHLQKATQTMTVHHGLYADETAEYCAWHLPGTHYLESWGDVRTIDGTASIVQPLIEPLYGGMSELELLAAAMGRPEMSSYEIVAEEWLARLGGTDPDSALRRALHDGWVPDSAAAPIAPAIDGAALAAAAGRLAATARVGGLEVALRPDPSILDGRFANNGWLQELPKPITKLTWDNVVLLSPRTAERLGVEGEELVEVTVEGRKVIGPTWILPGQADDVATLQFGYGRTRAGKIADGRGFAVQPLQSASVRFAAAATVVKAGGRLPLATTQGHHAIEWMQEESTEAERRHVVREASLAEFVADPSFANHAEPHLDPDASIHPGYAYDGYAWGMAIDLNACTGCNACVVACQAENNIPVVGKDQVQRGREMHWIRIDRYFRGDVDAPEGIAHQPIVCMQCEQAPCEVVCPVAATVHSSEGLNDMVYNRCVGTRYCANNCPYKVRRFNFLLYQDWETESFKLQRNPDVSVRSRGVMEKCTYCVQRINRARIAAEREAGKVADGAIRTACQQACPSAAIVFGNLNDAAAEVVRWKANPRNYALLEELGTRPRTTYLAMVKNPNPELVG